jgi:hypothetical protein
MSTERIEIDHGLNGATRTTVSPAVRHATAEAKVKQLLAVADAPLTLLPMAYRPAVLDFWTNWGFFVKDQMLTLAKRISVFIGEGMKPEELADVLNGINVSARNKPIMFQAELFAKIDFACDDFLRRKRTRAEAVKNRPQSQGSQIVNATVANFSQRFRSRG